MAIIKNLFFDFGGVLYRIEPERTLEALGRLQIPVADWLNQKDNIFFRFEKGEISSADFIRFLQMSSPFQPDEDEIVEAFTALLIELPLENLRMLIRLARHYNCFLVSNTCEIHYQKFSKQIYSSHLKKRFYDLFLKEYYSFELGLRKPEPELYSFILRDSGKKPEESLFIDDDEKNIIAAKNAGFLTFHFGNEGFWHELIHKFNLLI